MNYLKIYGREEEFKIEGIGDEYLISSVKSYIDNKFGDPSFRKSEEERERHSDSALRNFTGGIIYDDDDVTEICTPPYIEKKGFVENIINATVAQRLLLLEGFKELCRTNYRSLVLKGYSAHECRTNYRSLVLKGYSAHENISFNREKVPDNIASIVPEGIVVQGEKSDFYGIVLHSSIYRTIGPLLLLFFKNYNSEYGVGYDYKDHPSDRIQFRCDYVPNIDQLRAGIAFLYGTFRGIENKLLENYKKYSPKEFEIAFYNFFPFTFKSPPDSEYCYYLNNKEIPRPFIYYVPGDDDYRIDFRSYIKNNRTVNIKEKGSETKLTIKVKDVEKTISLTDALKEYVAFFNREIKNVADEKTLSILNEFASGKREFLIDNKELPEFYNLEADEVDKYIKYLIGNETPYNYLKRFKPQPEFEILAKAVEKNGKVHYSSSKDSLLVRTTSVGWDNLCFNISLKKMKKVKKTNRVKVQRDYFLFFDELLKKDLSPKKIYNNIRLVNAMYSFIVNKNYHLSEEGSIKNYELASHYLDYLKNKKKNNRENKDSEKKQLANPYDNHIINFENFIKFRKIKIPSIKIMSELEKMILR